MKRSDFHYHLPEHLIAQQPLARREDSRLLCVDRASGARVDRRFHELPGLLQPGDLLVFNDTRVIPARLYARKDTGGAVEVLVERILDDRRLLAQVRASKSPRAGTKLILGGGDALRVLGRQDEFFLLELEGEGSVLPLLEREGHIPLPPYIRREDVESDVERYQTVYARHAGAVAAPTAGLHFSEDLLARCREAGVETGFVTLHVGAGTFQPVRADDITDHVMHSECYAVGEVLCDQLARTRAAGGRVIAVGTTVVRTLESALRDGRLQAGAGETDIFITPGYVFQVIDGLITNFHLPESTLLMLVSAFAGMETTREAYAHAVNEEYRFFSYGDAMLVI